MNRGEIWWAVLPDPRGSEPDYRRPVVMVQVDDFNKSRINTVVAVAVTSNLSLARSPGNVPLPKRETKLDKDSVANVSQIVTLDKRFLTRCVGSLPSPLMHRIETGVRLVLGL